MPPFPISEAELVALFMESVTWGIQIVTFTQCVWALFETAKGGPRRVNVTLLTWAIALFVWGTLDISFSVYRNLTAFIYYTGPGGSNEIFNQISDYATVLRSVWNFLAILTADMALIHRCFVIYNRNWLIVVFPSLIWAASLASAAAEIYYSATFDALTNLAGAAKIEDFLNAFIALGVSLNIITTGECPSDFVSTRYLRRPIIAIILYRVGQLQNASARMLAAKAGKHDHIPSSDRMRWSQLSQILVESAVMYTLAGIILLIVNFAGSNAVYPVSDLTLQLAGIQYDMIIIRVCRGVAAEQVHSTVQYPLRDTTYSMRPELPPIEGLTSDIDTKSGRESGVEANEMNLHDYVATQV
ncbi:uncharacterized protein C8Q71DRAFT_890987 [Rhodofomes roseus]|uniref:Uncharacterized protein n=1 Tax=Rhodofomes roseus TaxID=34475 RepID=A0ABQ8KRJ8_9APHY|nr:uncharacterized protein C8Q71DRAFT_890987 [Rhodofomes roseus]KAH9841155.1 hypothetical protein C8Q71DRAFT_890987 [Rhodofomes roseus]